MAKSSSSKLSALAKKGAASSTLFNAKSGMNKRMSAKKTFAAKKTDINAGKSKVSKQFLYKGITPNQTEAMLTAKRQRKQNPLIGNSYIGGFGT